MIIGERVEIEVTAIGHDQVELTVTELDGGQSRQEKFASGEKRPVTPEIVVAIGRMFDRKVQICLDVPRQINSRRKELPEPR